MSSQTCAYDSGTITGCVPLCDAPADYVIRYRNGTYPGDWPVCAGHRRAAENRVYPGLVRVDSYAAHVDHGMLTYPTPEDPGTDAWAQLGPAMTDGLTEFYGVRGMDGREYVAEGAGGAWRIVRAGSYGLGAVTRADTLKGAVQHLNVFHVGETCAQCGNVNSYRGHACEQCGRIRYVNAAGEYVPAGER